MYSTIERKVKVNNRFRWEDTIKNVTLTPRTYWHSVLRAKLEKVLLEKALPNRRSDQVGMNAVDGAMIASISSLKINIVMFCPA